MQKRRDKIPTSTNTSEKKVPEANDGVQVHVPAGNRGFDGKSIAKRAIYRVVFILCVMFGYRLYLKYYGPQSSF